ncbi:hypothetical protein ABIB62_002134 [Mucilaginibacter sp. UYP25]
MEWGFDIYSPGHCFARPPSLRSEKKVTDLLLNSLKVDGIKKKAYVI